MTKFGLVTGARWINIQTSLSSFTQIYKGSPTFEPESKSIDEVHTHQLPRHRAEYSGEGWKVDLERPPGDRQHVHLLRANDHLAILNLFDLCNIWHSGSLWPSHPLQWFMHFCPLIFLWLSWLLFLEFFVTFSSSPYLPHTYGCAPGFCPRPNCLKMWSLVWFQSHLIFQPVCWQTPNLFLLAIFFSKATTYIFSIVPQITPFQHIQNITHFYPSKAIPLQTYSFSCVSYFSHWKQLSYYLSKPEIWVISLLVPPPLSHISKQSLGHFNMTVLK